MENSATTYEKLGAFYLGREYDLAGRKLLDDLVLYDSKDLVTHAVCVGMTGSGKTGLCISLLEEAAIDGIPALVIDPKGDLANLLLTFPDLKPADFLPWINQDDARRKGQTPEQFAAAQATLWRDGLADWNQDGQRIRRLKDAAEFAVYTPGSEAGLPISILSSFAAPPQAVIDDADAFRDRVTTTATSLLGLLGISGDPLRSREHILLATLLDGEWRKGRTLDLATLIRLIQQPPIDRIGVMDLESFFPEKDRFELAMTMNNLLASPGSAAWMTGQPLDVDGLLYTGEGKPRIAVLSIAHLSDAERMFFVSLLLNETISWMRSRPGTTSLRAIVYLDEVFGYMPPVAEPPSKKPLLTLLKQARAYGVGVVLATQNPVDLDYKGLSNTGTWLLGRLQTERDKMRVLDGLEGVAATSGGALDRGELERTLSGLGKRVFLLHNVHENAPVVFHSRWAMSYLCGPLTRSQIKDLMAPKQDAPIDSPLAHGGSPGLDAEETSSSQAVQTPPSRPGLGVSEGATSTPQPLDDRRPVLPPEIEQVFLPANDAADGELLYRPKVLGVAHVDFVDTRKGLRADRNFLLAAPIDDNIDWDAAEVVDVTPADLSESPRTAASFADVPPAAAKLTSYTSWKRSLADYLYRNERYELLKSTALGELSRPGECERDFRIRLTERAREERDFEIEKLRKKYTTKFASLRDKIRRAESTVEREQQEASGAKWDTAVSFGTTLLSAVLGRKALSSTNVRRAGTAARSASRASKQSRDVERARRDLAAYQSDLADLEAEFQEATRDVKSRLDPLKEQFDTHELKPRKKDVDVQRVALAWEVTPTA